VVLKDTEGILAGPGGLSPSDFEADSTAKEGCNEVGAVEGADGSIAGENGVSRPRLAVHEADEEPRESSERRIPSAVACISGEEVRERYTVLDAEWERLVPMLK